MSKLNNAVAWIDERFPLTKMLEEHVTKYYAPKNFNFWYYFGALSLLVLIIQVVTGIFLTMNYKPCLLYTSPSPRDATLSRMPSSA